MPLLVILSDDAVITGTAFIWRGSTAVSVISEFMRGDFTVAMLSGILCPFRNQSGNQSLFAELLNSQ